MADLETEGCTDPLILYMMDYTWSQSVTTDDQRRTAIQRFQSAVPALEQSNYPVTRKCFAHARYLQFALGGKLNGFFQNWKQDLTPEMNLALKEWPQALGESALSNWLAYELAQSLAYDWYRLSWDGKQFGDRGQVYSYLVPPWQHSRPDDIGSIVFTGQLYIDYAWDARGGGYANTVTTNGWHLMGQRLGFARAAFEKAFAMDPRDARAPTLMLAVILAQQSGRDDMETWFKRAMDANPDDFDACMRKLTFLEPKWGGGGDDMIAFGRECRDSGNYEARIPFVLVEAYARLTQYTQNPSDVYRAPGVWDDIRSVYEADLALYPDAVFDRSYYAYYAFICGQTAIARDQFKILGDHPVLQPFGTKEKYDEMVKQAGTQ